MYMLFLFTISVIVNASEGDIKKMSFTTLSKKATQENNAPHSFYLCVMYETGNNIEKFGNS